MTYPKIDMRPDPHTKTGRVWQIADELAEREGRIPTGNEVARAYANEGGNLNTALTQYSHWKKAYYSRREHQSDSANESSGASRNVAVVRLTLGSDGRLMIPAQMRAAMRVSPGEVLSLRVENGELRASTPSEALRRAQEELRPLAEELKRNGISLVDELIADRREEALREAQE